MAETKAPSRWAWYSLGVFIALGNYVLAIVALLKSDLFLFMVGFCVGTFVTVPLVEAWKDNHDVN